MRNCRAYNSINVESDHRIVCAKIKVSFRSCPKSKPSLNIDWSKLCSPSSQQRFNLEINKSFDLLEETSIEPDLQSSNDSFVNTVNQVALKVLGKKQKSKLPPWVSETTIELVQQRDDARAKYPANNSNRANCDLESNWRSLCQAVEEAYDRDEREHLACQLAELKEAKRQRNTAKMLKSIRAITGTSLKTPAVFKSSRNRCSKKEIIREWRDYFEKLLNNPSATHLTRPPEAALSDLDIDTST